MSESKANLRVVKSTGSDGGDGGIGEKRLLKPPPNAGLTGTGYRVWDYLCESMTNAGFDISSAGLHILLLTTTYLEWVECMALIKEHGRMATGKKGVPYELPHSHNEKRARHFLCSQLPESCLTAMSLVDGKLKQSKIQGGPQQDDLFDDLLTHRREGGRLG